MLLVTLNDTSKKALIFMADSNTPTVGKTGLAPTVRISKNGAAFGAGAGSVAELEGGFYAYTYGAGDVDTLGPLGIRATAAGAVDFAGVRQVVSFNPYDAAGLGLSRIDAAITSRASATVAPSWYTAPTNADPLANVVPGSYAAGTAGFDIGQTYTRLGSVSVTFTSPLSTDGGTLQIIRGDDYAFADGRQVGPFTDSGGTWPNLTGGTARLLTFPSAGTGLNLVGTITNPGTANQGVYFEPLAAQTSIQTLGGYPFHVVFTLSNGHTVTQIEGNTIVT